MKENIRPWGEYKVTKKEKIITVKPNQRLSLQYHKNRTEIWTITNGTGEVQIDDKVYQAETNMSFLIKVGVIHRITAGPKGIEFVEIAEGDVDEDDIVRMEDDYGR